MKYIIIFMLVCICTLTSCCNCFGSNSEEAKRQTIEQQE